MADADADPPSSSSPQPTSSGPGWGVIGGLMRIADPSLLMNLGMGLMAGAKYGSNAGEGLLQGMQSYREQKAAALQQQLGQQQLGMNALQMQMLKARLPAMQAFMQQLPGAMGQGSATPASGAPPQGGLMPTASTPNAAPTAQGAAPASPQSQSGDPFAMMRLGALGGVAGMPGAENLTELGKAQLQYNPQLATQMEAAKNAVAVDQQQIQQALAQGNRPMAEAIYNGKLQQDLGLLKISSMGGIQTRVNPATGVISTLNPSTGIESTGNQASLMPGMTSALQQKAAAEAQGEATAKPIMLTDDAQGSHTGTPFAQYPVALSSVVGRSTGTSPGPSAPKPAAAPASSAPPFAAPPGAAPGATGGRSPVAELGPGTHTMLTGNAAQAVEANKEYQSQADAGQQMLVQTQELRNAANDFSPGQFAETRLKALQYLNSSGLISADQMKSLGSAQEGQKIAIQLQAAATKQLGSREAAQIFQYMGKSLPNLTLSQDGLDKVSGYMDGIARYNIARAQVAQQRGASLDVNGVNNVRNEFIQNTNPLYFVVASSPPAIQKEIVQSMGAQAPAFVASWRNAAGAGWAPKPSQYWGANANAGSAP